MRSRIKRALPTVLAVGRVLWANRKAEIALVAAAASLATQLARAIH